MMPTSIVACTPCSPYARRIPHIPHSHTARHSQVSPQCLWSCDSARASNLQFAREGAMDLNALLALVQASQQGQQQPQQHQQPQQQPQQQPSHTQQSSQQPLLAFLQAVQGQQAPNSGAGAGSTVASQCVHIPPIRRCNAYALAAFHPIRIPRIPPSAQTGAPFHFADSEFACCCAPFHYTI